MVSAGQQGVTRGIVGADTAPPAPAGLAATPQNDPMGIAVSWVGIRSLRALIDPVSYDELGTDMQKHVFTLVDVVVTGALIAGGSNGMHELMQTITEFFGKTRDKINPDRNNP